MNKCRQNPHIVIPVIFLLSAGAISQRTFAEGGITTDGTVGVSATLSGANVDIPENLGSRRGANLFHSFSEFNVHDGQTVTFQENALNSTDNVISRVTGSSGSNIDGLLQVTPGGKANYYLINPNGVAFGPNGSVNVPGSIHLSTADEIKFEDGQVFSAVQPMHSSLSSAPPVAFGFLGTSSSNNRLFEMDSSFIEVKEKNSFDVVAGQIDIRDALIDIFQGEVRLVAVKGLAEISTENKTGVLSLPDKNPDNLNSGNITLQAANIEIRGSNTGNIGIWGNNLTLSGQTFIALENGDLNTRINKGINILANSFTLKEGSSINTFTQLGALEKSANINIETTSDLDINNGFISALSAGVNDSGDITIKTRRNFIIQNLGSITTLLQAGGFNNKSGDITINAQGDIQLMSEGNIKSVNQGGSGKLGDIKIIGDGNMVLENDSETNEPTGILTKTVSEARAGNIEINLKGNLNILGSSRIDSSTVALGNSGDVNISAKNVTLNGGGSKISTLTEDRGHAGNIELIANNDISIKNGSQLNSSTNGVGDGGFINLNARNISLDGNQTIISTATTNKAKAGDIKIISNEHFVALNGSQIDSGSTAEGSGGTIDIKANRITLEDNGTNISTAAENKGNAGNIKFLADNNFSIKNGSLIDSGTSGEGNGGNINIKASNVSVEKAFVNAEAKFRNSGNPGNIEIKGLDRIDLDQGLISIKNQTVKANFAQPSRLSLSAPVIDIKNSRVTTQATGNQAAGSITIAFKENLKLDPSFISTESQDGDGGEINIKGAGDFFLNNSSLTTNVRGTKGNGGNINISTDNLVLETGLIQANTAARNAKGGYINLIVNALIASGNQLIIGGSEPIAWRPGLFGLNIIQAAAPGGINGTIQINSPVLNLSGTLANLGNPQFETDRLDWDNCLLNSRSTLTRSGNGAFIPGRKNIWAY